MAAVAAYKNPMQLEKDGGQDRRRQDSIRPSRGLEGIAGLLKVLKCSTTQDSRLQDLLYVKNDISVNRLLLEESCKVRLVTKRS